MVLLVVKHKPTHEALDVLIASKGYQTLTAECGDEALHCVRTFRPRLVILDCGLPDSFDVLSDIRKEKVGKKTPIVMFSENESEARQRAMDAGADAFVAKGSLDWARIFDELIRFAGPPFPPPQT